MIFAEMDLASAEGALLAHSVKAAGVAFRKGRKLTAADVAALRAAGQTSVTAVRLEAGDVPEDEAAATLARAVSGPHLSSAAPFTGRANLLADLPGLLVVDPARLDALNMIDESVTLATLAPFDLLAAGEMAATIKVIPFSVPRPVLERCLALIAEGGPILRLAPLRPRRVGLIQTRLPGMKESILDKTLQVTNQRMAQLDCPPAVERR